jgi:hypothetical protein
MKQLAKVHSRSRWLHNYQDTKKKELNLRGKSIMSGAWAVGETKSEQQNWPQPTKQCIESHHLTNHIVYYSNRFDVIRFGTQNKWKSKLHKTKTTERASFSPGLLFPQTISRRCFGKAVRKKNRVNSTLLMVVFSISLILSSDDNHSLCTKPLNGKTILFILLSVESVFHIHSHYDGICCGATKSEKLSGSLENLIRIFSGWPTARKFFWEWKIEEKVKGEKCWLKGLLIQKVWFNCPRRSQQPIGIPVERNSYSAEWKFCVRKPNRFLLACSVRNAK